MKDGKEHGAKPPLSYTSLQLPLSQPPLPELELDELELELETTFTAPWDMAG